MTEPERGDDLQFDRVERDEVVPAETTCGICGDRIDAEYYESGGGIVCPGCRAARIAERERGSRWGRMARALALGTLAAAVGSALWYGISALTGYEFGLIAIVIGLMVGGAVRLGSRGRGGWAYQTLAMFLTYVSIVSTYAPALFEALGDAAAESATEVEAVEGSDPTSSVATLGAAPLDTGAPPAPAAIETAVSIPGEPAPAESGGALVPGLLGLILGVALLALILLAAPFLAGFENFMGWIILAIGLYQAWNINRKQVEVFAGPFRIAGDGTIPATEPATPSTTP